VAVDVWVVANGESESLAYPVSDQAIEHFTSLSPHEGGGFLYFLPPARLVRLDYWPAGWSIVHGLTAPDEPDTTTTKAVRRAMAASKVLDEMERDASTQSTLARSYSSNSKRQRRIKHMYAGNLIQRYADRLREALS